MRQIKNPKGNISNLNPDTVYSISIWMISSMICDSIIGLSILDFALILTENEFMADFKRDQAIGYHLYTLGPRPMSAYLKHSIECLWEKSYCMLRMWAIDHVCFIIWINVGLHEKQFHRFYIGNLTVNF